MTPRKPLNRYLRKGLSDMRRKTLVLAILVLAVLMLYPIQTQVAPEWMIQTVDESGRPLPGVRLRESWKNYRIGRETQEADNH